MLRTIFKVHPHDVRRQPTIRDLINFIEDKVHEIESREQRGREIDILRDWQVRIIF